MLGRKYDESQLIKKLNLQVHLIEMQKKCFFY